MKAHYAKIHQDIMQSKANLSDQEKMTEMKKWMDEAKAKFDAEPEDN